MFSNKKIKFPSKKSLEQEESRAIALHFFLNHELLAIEMMSWALINFENDPKLTNKIKKSLLATISEEQTHLKLYRNRMKDWGVEFGDYPVNSFFWDQIQNIKNFSQFIILMSLTFEQANLDFSMYYKNLFQSFDDFETSKIMNKVLEDEITHVSRGVGYLENWTSKKDLWKYYIENLPQNITPSRSIGIHFNEESRIKSGLSQDFIENLKNFTNIYTTNFTYESELCNRKMSQEYKREMNSMFDYIFFILEDNKPLYRIKDYSVEYKDFLSKFLNKKIITGRSGNFKNWWGSLENKILERKLNSKETSFNIEESLFSRFENSFCTKKSL